MIITCPDCSTGYLLPDHLMGQGGARVRCPRCQHLFAVGVDGRPRELAHPVPGGAQPERPLDAVEEVQVACARPPVKASEPGTGAESGTEGHLAVARSVLEELVAREGEAIERAKAGHRFFAEFGPALMEAYEAYRGRAGEGADPSAFRTALRERWGVELVPLTTREA